jgi:predicted Zn-dependent protease
MRKALALISALWVMLASLAPPGARAQPAAASGPVIVRDAETESLLRSFLHPLFQVAGVDSGLVRIVLVQARPINAFVTTGNRLVVNTGLIQQSDKAEDVIGVLAHETGHIAAGHVARLPEELRNAMIRSIGAMLLGGAAAAAGGRNVGGNPAALMLGGQAMAMGELYAFTRGQEQAADQAGVTYLDRLGWSSRGMIRIMERLQEQELLTTERQDPYFRTHPLSKDRLAFLREHLARSRAGAGALPPGFETGFAMVKAKLDGFLDSPMTTWRRYPESDGSAPARYARAIAQARSGRTGVALEILEPLARELPPSRAVWLQELKGQILFEGGRPREAMAAYREAARLAPGEPQIRTALGRAMLETGDPVMLRPAAVELEAAIRVDREDAPAWRQLAIAKGRLGQVAEADLALAEEAMLNEDYGAARMLSRRAEAALPPGPLRLRAQDLRFATQRDNMTREQREAEDSMRRRTGQ